VIEALFRGERAERAGSARSREVAPRSPRTLAKLSKRPEELRKRIEAYSCGEKIGAIARSAELPLDTKRGDR
jgi:hypothetical protein